MAIKARGKIFFINLDDVVAVQADGKCVWLQQNARSYLLRESISVVAERLETHGFIRIHRSVLVNTSFVEEIRPLSTGEDLSSNRRWKGIHGHPHLQEKSQVARGVLDGQGRILPGSNSIAPVVHLRVTSPSWQPAATPSPATCFLTSRNIPYDKSGWRQRN